MYRFFVEEGQIGQGEAVITGGDVNHIRNVLRMRPGDKVMVSDGKERDYCCRLKEIGCDRVIADILEKKPAETELPARLYLFQGLPKSDKMELIIQKAVELGVYQVIPVVTRRAVVKLDEKREEAKVRRWNKIAESAAKQSGRSVIPQVTEVMSFKEALTFAGGFEVKVIPFQHRKGMGGNRPVIRSFGPAMGGRIFFGLVGGIEDGGIALSASAGGLAGSPGRRVLRAGEGGGGFLSVIGYLLETR